MLFHPHLPEKRGVMALYMQDYHVLINNKDIVSPVYAIGTSTDTKHHKRATTAHQFIHEQAKYSSCRQVSSRVVVLGSALYYDKIGFLVRTAPV